VVLHYLHLILKPKVKELETSQEAT
jgi:hypothetical protein